MDENYIWRGTGWHNFTSFSGTKFANAKDFIETHLESEADHHSQIDETKTHSSATSLSIRASDYQTVKQYLDKILKVQEQEEDPDALAFTAPIIAQENDRKTPNISAMYVSQKTENWYKSVSKGREGSDENIEEQDVELESPVIRPSIGDEEEQEERVLLNAYSDLMGRVYLEVDDQRDLELITPSVPEERGGLEDDDFFYQNTVERQKAKVMHLKLQQSSLQTIPASVLEIAKSYLDSLLRDSD